MVKCIGMRHERRRRIAKQTLNLATQQWHSLDIAMFSWLSLHDQTLHGDPSLQAYNSSGPRLSTPGRRIRVSKQRSGCMYFENNRPEGEPMLRERIGIVSLRVRAEQCYMLHYLLLSAVVIQPIYSTARFTQ